MKIDEQEFRSFIANLGKYIGNSTYLEDSKLIEEDYEILEITLRNQLRRYLTMLETPKPSKWKQLKLLG